MKKDMKSFLKILSIYFGIICIFTVALIWMDRFQAGSKLGLSSNYDWLAFIGNCLSNFVAVSIPLYVMFYTFSNQKEDEEWKRQREMAPILQIKLVEKQGLFGQSEINTGDTDDEACEFKNVHDSINLVVKSDIGQCWSVLVKIKNVGNSYAKNVFYSLKVNGEERNIQSNSIYGVVGKDDLDKCYLNFRVKDYQGPYNADFTITYEDMFDNKYVQRVRFVLKECKMSNIEIDAPEKND